MKTRTRISREVENTKTCEAKDDSTRNGCSVTSEKTIVPTVNQELGSSISNLKSGEKEYRTYSNVQDVCVQLGKRLEHAEDSILTQKNKSAKESNTNLKSEPKLSKNSGVKKSKNLDLVVRRMLRAKKEGEERSIPCEESEIISCALGINSASESTESVTDIDTREGESVVKPRRRNTKDIHTVEGMIDVERLGDNVLEKGIPAGTSVLASNKKKRSSSNGCSSPEFSPQSNTSDLDTPNPPQTSRKGCKDQQHLAESDKMTMSALIKQEPVGLTDTHSEIYTRGREASHSPASSYNSVPSVGQRSPSPKSPLDQHEDGQSNTDLLTNQVMRQLASPNALSMINASASQHIPQHMLESVGYRRVAMGGSPPSDVRGRAFPEDISGMATAALLAKGVGPPTLVPASSSIPSSEAYNQFLLRGPAAYRDAGFQNPFIPTIREGSNPSGFRVSPTAPMGRTPTRGIIGHKEAAAAAGENRSGRRSSGNADEKCAYKRPPHTYPALIASAILDSPGNLITLRGIYDYIMNNFPYYKFGHDKSAWQNSIRHNLSLNQCFIKVPRYENAAKSNYWTMTREGFEEFGNENSFKRRRRRGATLAPISAYKNKKMHTNNEGNRGVKQRGIPDMGCKDDSKFSNWRSRTPEPRLDANGTKPQKRPYSPNSDPHSVNGGKNPRMMVLKQGDGPNLDGMAYRADGHPQRPNSLSSVEEMQVNVNSFTKSLSSTADNNKRDSNRNPNHAGDRNSPMEHLKQQWMLATAMQKNFNLFNPGMLQSLHSTSPSGNVRERFNLEAEDQISKSIRGMRIPIIYEGTEIGTKTPVYYDSVGPGSKWTFECKFCEYKYVEENPNLLEQHCQMLHQIELPNMRAKLAAAAAVSSRINSEQNMERKSPSVRQDQANGSPLTNIGWPQSLLAAAASYSNAQNFLAAAQGSGLNLPMPGAYPDAFTGHTAHTPFDSLTRALAQQLSPNDIARSSANDSMRSRAGGNDTIQQVSSFSKQGDSSAMTQEHMRQLLYQQLLPQSPFFPGPNSALPRSVAPGQHGNDVSDLAHKLWLYHQKVLELTTPNATDKDGAINSTNPLTASNTQQQEKNPAMEQGSRLESEAATQNRDEATKEIFSRHKDAVDSNNSEEQSVNTKIPKTIETNAPHDHSSTNHHDGSKMATVRISRSASLSSNDRVDCSTQTANENSRRSCIHCDLTFGDDTMHALHMTCHDRDDPFRCTICGQDCHEKYYFNVHLLRGLHQPVASGNDGRTNKANRDDSGAPSREEEIEKSHTEKAPGPFVSNGVTENSE